MEWSKDAWPVVEKIGMLACWNSGTTAVASSEPPPSTPTSELDNAIRRFAAGTASAGSPFASTGVQMIWCPSTPPAALISRSAGKQPAAASGPYAAFGPE